MANDGSVTDLALPEVDDIAAVAAEAVANSGAAGPKEMKFEPTYFGKLLMLNIGKIFMVTNAQFLKNN